ncbi:hypothetical protein BKA67DRAFT_652685 [Truncatella angustata]|uniref:Aminoglycoside phosphotransferase domain-containing protein n=1 Tax=Truncatella angustata TaxID=152316 RepID=A0A9P8UW58_9PEZI|nr:uncharacterized protein BKA67DRAFT_652685 [Truncatella angustata]KAH6659457.1 hypothetical protein BKA67DRAFT_652685 [Truncatella angustata]
MDIPAIATKTPSTPGSPSSILYPSPGSRPTTPRSESVIRYETGDDYYQPPPFWFPRIQALCKTLWPNARHNIAFLAVGTYNKVFGLSVLHEDGAACGEYVLKLPELEDTVTNTVGVLRYLERRTSPAEGESRALRLPEVVGWDGTKDNDLGYPYIMTKRIPGMNLGKEWEALAQSQRMAVATQIARLYMDFESISSAVTGIINVPPTHNTAEKSISPKPDELLEISAFGTTFAGDQARHTDFEDEENGLLPLDRLYADPPGLPVGEMMLAPLKRRISQALHQETPDLNIVEYHYKPLLYILGQLNEGDIFASVDDGNDEDTRFCLWNLDLTPSNIMIDYATNHEPYITGILDWEAAIFGPRFMTAEPPRWLWTNEVATKSWPEYDPEPLHKRLMDADSRDDDAIKGVFEQAMGPEWLSNAYDPEFVFARQILKLSMLSVWGQAEVDESEDIQLAWDGFCDERQTEAEQETLEETLADLNISREP